MMIPRDPRDTSLVCPWGFHGSMGLPLWSDSLTWDSHETFVGPLWCTHRTSKGLQFYPCAYRDALGVFPWFFHGKFMGVPLPGESHVTLDEILWCFQGNPTGIPRDIHGTSV